MNKIFAVVALLAFIGVGVSFVRMVVILDDLVVELSQQLVACKQGTPAK